jgi:hypothetical protein
MADCRVMAEIRSSPFRVIRRHQVLRMAHPQPLGLVQNLVLKHVLLPVSRPLWECWVRRRQRTMRLYGREIRLECQLAAFNYANALHTLKAEYRK